MTQQALAARIRTETGKGAARRLRQKSQVPAIFYGPGAEPVMLTVESAQLFRLEKAGKGENAILDLTIQSEKGDTTKKVMIKELTIDPLERTFIHADFYEISNDRELTLAIPIHLLNTPAGVTDGGILQQIRRELLITCFPDKLVDSLDIDISDMQIGDALRIGDINLPEGLLAVEEAHLTVAVVNARSAAVEEELEGEEAEETEETAAESEEETAEESKE